MCGCFFLSSLRWFKEADVSSNYKSKNNILKMEWFLIPQMMILV